MPRAAALTLVLLGACSRSPAVLDEAPATSSTTAGVPAAAASARVEPVNAAVTATATATVTGSSTGGPGWVPPSAALLRTPRIHVGSVTTSSNSLPTETIQRIVRQNFGRLSLCYESSGDPELAGAVRVRFIIETDGTTGVVSDAGSDLPDAGVVACMERAFGNLTFPAPTSGAMTVTYSVSFTPRQTE